jgi:acyl-CoA dehydrogenase
MFELTDEQRDIRQAAREFAEGEFTDIAAEHDETETFPTAVWKKACESGFIGAFIEEKYEGAGFGMLECALILEEFWRVDPGCGNMLLSALGAEFIQDYGNEEQKKTYLIPLTKGEATMGTVPGEDYIRDAIHYDKHGENKYILNGLTKFVMNGTNANHLVVVAKRQDSEGKSKRQFSTFVIDKKLKGIRTIDFSDKLGVRASDICNVNMEDVIVSSANLVGKEGQGLAQFDTFLDRLCIYNSAQALGAAQGCLERAIKYSRQRVQFGHPIGWFQQVQFKVGEMATRVEAARNLCYKAADQFDHGKKDRRMISMASWFSRETSSMAAAETLQIHGGYGYMKEMDIERFYRDVQFLEFFGSPREREKIRVAVDLLGKLR